MIGVLLAGGAATRLPNKPLLPQHDWQPVCFSGLDFLLRDKDINQVNVIVPTNSVIVDIIARRYHDHRRLNFIYQAQPTGVGDAINLGTDNGSDSALIVAADNIYPTDELGLVEHDVTIAILRRVPAWQLPHLVRMNLDGKLTRNGPGWWALTSPWYAPKGKVFSQLGWPDFQDGRFVQREAKGWWDIGTPETYASYWRSK